MDLVDKHILRNDSQHHHEYCHRIQLSYLINLVQLSNHDTLVVNSIHLHQDQERVLFLQLFLQSSKDKQNTRYHPQNLHHLRRIHRRIHHNPHHLIRSKNYIFPLPKPFQILDHTSLL